MPYWYNPSPACPYRNEKCCTCLFSSAYETIVPATSGEPETVGVVLKYYERYIQYAARIRGQADRDAEDFITETLLKALFKFRMDSPPLTTEYRCAAEVGRRGEPVKSGGLMTAAVLKLIAVFYALLRAAAQRQKGLYLWHFLTAQ